MKKLRCSCLLVGLLFVGCAKGTVERPIIRLLALEYSTQTRLYWQEVVKAFNTTSSDVVVELTAVPWDQGEQHLWDAIAQKEPFDLACVASPWLNRLIAEDQAESLDIYAKSEFKERFLPQLLETTSYRGHLYGVPFAASARLLYIRSDLVASGSEDAEVPPLETWEDLQAVAQSMRDQVQADLTAVGDTTTDPLEVLFPVGLAFGGEDAPLLFSCFLYAAGGRFFDGDGRCVLDSPEAKRALKFLVSLREKGLCNPDADELQGNVLEKLFQNERVGLAVGGSWLAHTLRAESPALEFGLAPLLSLSDKAGVSALLTADALVMLNTCSNKHGAWQFVEYVYQFEQRRSFVARELTLPVLVEVSADIEKLADQPEAARHSLYLTLMEQQNLHDLAQVVKLVREGRALPLHPQREAVFTRLIPYLRQALRKELTPEEALNQATSEISALLSGS